MVNFGPLTPEIGSLVWATPKPYINKSCRNWATRLVAIPIGWRTSRNCWTPFWLQVSVSSPFYGRSCDRKNDPLPILPNVTVTVTKVTVNVANTVTDIRHRHSSRSLSVTDTRHRHRHLHRGTTRGIPYHSPQVTSGSVQLCRHAVADRHTDTQTRVTTIHFALSTTYSKYNNSLSWSIIITMVNYGNSKIEDEDVLADNNKILFHAILK